VKRLAIRKVLRVTNFKRPEGVGESNVSSSVKRRREVAASRGSATMSEDTPQADRAFRPASELDEEQDDKPTCPECSDGMASEQLAKCLGCYHREQRRRRIRWWVS
jgi:hypothetical protein